MNWFARFKLHTAWYPDEIHILIGTCVVLAFAGHPWVGFAIAAAWALFVELWWDPRYERGTTRPDLGDVRDIADYLVGGLLGVLVVFVKGLLLHLVHLFWR